MYIALNNEKKKLYISPKLCIAASISCDKDLECECYLFSGDPLDLGSFQESW